MDIIVYHDRRDSTIGREVIDGENHGDFYVNSSGQVWYRYDSFPERFVNRDRPAFERSAAAWRWYRSEVAQFADEQGQLVMVDELRRKLNQDPAALAQPEAYWSVILEQAQEGLL
jgi:hypothetical protein